MSSANPKRVEPESMQVAVEIGAATHQGYVRSNNEDSYLVARACRTLETLNTNLPSGTVPACSAERSYALVVADGIGGQAAGEVASRLAIATLIEHAASTSDWILRDAAAHHERIEERMAERFSEADSALRLQAEIEPRLSGMGTTMTLAVNLGCHVFLGHVGDSRAYLFRRGQLRALTRDHSIAQAMADAGILTEREAAVHHFRHVLLRSLGGGDATADVRHGLLESGDQLLLCTDGLTDMVTESRIGEILRLGRPAQEACDRLVSAALDAGGVDNVTVVMARYDWST